MAPRLLAFHDRTGYLCSTWSLKYGRPCVCRICEGEMRIPGHLGPYSPWEFVRLPPDSQASCPLMAASGVLVGLLGYRHELACKFSRIALPAIPGQCLHVFTQPPQLGCIQHHPELKRWKLHVCRVRKSMETQPSNFLRSKKKYPPYA